MCIGIFMQVVIFGCFEVICEWYGQMYLLLMMLIGEQFVGIWVLMYFGFVICVLDEVEVCVIDDVLIGFFEVVEG